MAEMIAQVRTDLEYAEPALEPGIIGMCLTRKPRT
jgi:hypothetical protein